MRRNQRGILCDRCERWTHSGCGGVSAEEYARLCGENNDLWYCPNCLLEQLPFANVSRIDISSTSESEDQVLIGSGHEQGLISCLLLNVRSLINKRFEFKAMLNNKEPKVVAVTETFLDPEVLNSARLIQYIQTG